jgi:1-phosphofructokinase family hexose kinase
MVLTVTFNPVLERKLFFNQIRYGASNRSIKELLNSGGKGINISRQLNVLGIENIALTFAGGNNGKIFRRLLVDENINHVLISTKAEMRYSINAIDYDRKNVTIFFSQNIEYTADEYQQFYEKYEKILSNASVVVFAGSCPTKDCENILLQCISKAKELDKITMLDTYGSYLSEAINSAPMVIHANVNEVQDSMKVDLSTDDLKISFLKELYSKGIKLAFLTDGKNKFFVSKFDFIYKVTPPEINEVDATGSGDSFLAGIVYGMEKALVFDDFVKVATALGSANAEVIETSKVFLPQYEKYLNQVQVMPVGKKMKLINDSPNQ